MFVSFIDVFTWMRRPVTSLEHQEGRRFFWEGPNFFELCPIVSSYVQHIFPGSATIFLGWASPPLVTGLWIRMISCQWDYAIWCRSFYAKLAFFNELYVTLQTDFAARWCFCFSANDSSVEQVCPSCYNVWLVTAVNNDLKCNLHSPKDYYY